MNAYDEVPYPAYTHPQTHPDRLATVARLHGLRPAGPARCRVLEMGAGNGSNLIPMACMLPDSEFVGIDLAERPVAAGAKQIADLGLSNIRLVQGDITTLDESWGRFDYIIAHGVFSWVPPAVRESMLASCRRLLGEHGVAFVSYNANPGGHIRTMLREMMLYHVHGFTDAGERTTQARALASFIAAGGAPKDEFRELMRAEAERVLRAPSPQLFHDDLAENFRPFYFTEFVHQANGHGLRYLGEADYFETVSGTLPAQTRQVLDQLSGDRIRREQYLDFIKCRRFRQTLLCHTEREVRSLAEASVLAGMFVSTPLEARNPGQPLRQGELACFESAKGAKVETDFDLGKAALAILIERAPGMIPMEELLDSSRGRLAAAGLPTHDSPEAAEGLRAFLLSLYGSGAVSLHSICPSFSTTVSDRPRTTELARWQVTHDCTLTSAFHTAVEIEDDLGLHLLSLLDGTRDHDTLAAEMHSFIAQRGAFTPDALRRPEELKALVRADLERNLTKLARHGLLAG